MAVHVAKIQLVNVTPLGVVKPTREGMSIADVCNNLKMDHRIMPDTDYPNTVGYPTLKAYLTLEEASGFKLGWLDQYNVITYG